MDTVCPACGGGALDIDVACPSCGQPLSSDEARRRIGTRVLEHYEVTDVLGQGGMSVVYRGRHQLTHQEVALKILPPELAAHAQVKSRFLEEARALAQLDHPNIVHLYNFGQDDGCLVLAMQFVPGHTWERLIMTSGRLDWQRSVTIAIDVLKALENAHERGVIHRDMKPSNVLVRDDGTALVMDFGIAKMTTSSRLTATGQTMGTVRYMSPEQVRGQEVCAQTDLYSLAVTLYESLTGDTPFDGDSHFEIMTAHLSAAPPPLSGRGIEVPPALEQLIMSGLEKKPERRPPDARTVRAALEDILATGGGAAVAPGAAGAAVTPVPAAAQAAGGARARSPGRARRMPPFLWLVMGAAALVAGAVATALVMHGSHRAAGDAGATPAHAAAAGGDRAGSGAGAEPNRAASWPPPHILSGLQFAVNQRFDSDRLRVLSVAARDAAQLDAAVKGARRDFTAYLGRHGVKGGIQAPPLNLIVVPRERMCDPGIYESGQAPAGCETSDYWYRPGDKTLYLADGASAFDAKLAFAVAAAMCLHSTVPGCDAATVQFAEADLHLDPGR